MDETAVGSAAHQALALEAARQGIVLLKHTAGVLPFKRGGGSPVLIGPTLEVRKGGYSTSGSDGNLTGTTASAIASYAGGGGSAPPMAVVVGCADPATRMGKRHSSAIDCAYDAEGFAAAVAAAKAAKAGNVRT